MNKEKTIIRAGAAEVYGHVPLLAADFTSNQERVLSFFDSSGTLIGQPNSFGKFLSSFRAPPQVGLVYRANPDQVLGHLAGTPCLAPSAAKI